MRFYCSISIENILNRNAKCEQTIEMKAVRMPLYLNQTPTKPRRSRRNCLFLSNNNGGKIIPEKADKGAHTGLRGRYGVNLILFMIFTWLTSVSLLAPEIRFG